MTKLHELLKQISERAKSDGGKRSDDFGHDCQKLLEFESEACDYHCNVTIPRLVKALECAIRQRDLSMQELLSARYPAERTDKTADGIKSIYNRELAAILEGE